MVQIFERWRREPWRFWMTLYGVGILACGGPATGQRTPGGGTPLDPDPGVHTIGALAVQPDESGVWFVHQGTDPNGTSISLLASVDTASGSVAEVADLSGTTDRWLLFPGFGRAILLAHSEGAAPGEILGVIDTDLPAIASSAYFSGAHFREPRVSPSGAFLAVVSDSSASPQLLAIDTVALTPDPVLSAGTAESIVEAEWAHGHDWLIATQAAVAGPGSTRITRSKFDANGAPASPDVDLTIPGFCMWPDTRNIAVSPDDHWAAITLFDCATSGDPLIVIDLLDGSYRTSTARGPVTFTPDSSAIVSWDVTDAGSKLQVLPLGTLIPNDIPVPVDGLFDYFVTPGGAWIVCSPILNDGSLALYDTTTGAVSHVSGPHVSLSEFVVRPGYPELWLADQEQLWKLDLPSASVSFGGVFFPVRHLNVLPSRDELVVSEPEGGSLRFFRMSDRSVRRLVLVPSPIPPAFASGG